MRSKGLVVLTVCTAVAVGAAAWSAYWRATSHALPTPPATLFPGLEDKVNDVAKVAVVSAEGHFTVAKGKDGTWSMLEKGGYPVTYETVKQVVVGLATMAPIEAKTARADRLGKIKLADPRKDGDDQAKGVLIQLLDKNGKDIAAVIVGKTRSVQTSDRPGWYYVRKRDQTQSWLVAARLEVWEKAKSWLDSATVRIERKRIHAVSNRRPNGDRVEISRPNPEQTDFKVDNLPDGYKMIHDTVANGMGSALGYISFDDVAPADKVDFSNAVVTTFRTFDGLVLTVRVVAHDDDNWVHFAAAYDPDAVDLQAVSEADKKKMKTADEVRAEAKQINQRYGDWAYDVPKYKADDFTTKMSSLATPKKASGS